MGILSTAGNRGEITLEHQEILNTQLAKLNKVGELLGKLPGVHAMTDITGFGLLGHLIEMAEGSGLGAELYYSQIPIIDSAKIYLGKKLIPDATYRNWNSYSQKVAFEPGVPVMEAFSVLPDPQTNGGLLVSVSPELVNDLVNIFCAHGLDSFINPIGKMIHPPEKIIQVKN